jgi:hypothetical protein
LQVQRYRKNAEDVEVHRLCTVRAGTGGAGAGAGAGAGVHR